MPLIQKNSLRAGTGFALLVASLLTTSAQAGTPPSYTFHSLGTLNGGSHSQGYGVNDVGQVAGYSYTASGSSQHAFLSNTNVGMLRDLGTLGSGDSAGLGVDNAGQVTGYSSYHAFLSDPNGGTLHNLGTLGGFSSEGRGVNSSGQVAGDSYVVGNTTSHAFLSDVNGGTLHDLGTLAGKNGASGGYGVNNAGQVTGFSSLSGKTAEHAFLSDANGGALHDLGTLGGSGTSIGYGVNNEGQVVGTSDIADFSAKHAFLSATNGGTLQDLGTLGGGYSAGLGINDMGQVVGDSYTNNDPLNHGDHAFLFTGGQMLDLDSLITNSTDGFQLVQATSISNTGFITGYCINSGVEEAFLLAPNNVPVPEASSALSFGFLALSGVAVVRKRKVGNKAA